jgi:Dolichyl-phosphate-mannose-protein mannosyltransferase
MSPRSAVLWSLVAAGLVARVLWLDTLPGINGDEAWYGVQVATGALSLRTPTGNLVNPLHLGPLALLQPFAPLAAWVLRAPAVLSGVLTVALGYVLLRRSLGVAAAMVFTALAASSPDLIAYARFGWDASGTPLVSLAALHLALSRRWGWTAAVMGFAVVVHPTNALLAAPVAALFVAEHSKQGASHRRLFVYGGAAAVGVAVLCAALAAVVRFDLRAALGGVAPAPGETFLTMLTRYGDLVSGVTVYRYIAGPLAPAVAFAHRAVMALVVAPVTVLGCVRAWREGERRPAALGLGVVLSLAALYAVFGTFPLTPGSERYGQFLVVPSLVLVAWSIATLAARREALGFMAAAVVSAALFGCVGGFYFRPLRVEGGGAHRTFRVGSREPKVMIADAIRADRQRGPVVLAEDWWTGVPLEYLLARTRGVRVLRHVEGVPAAPPVVSALRAGGYVVGWHEGLFHHTILESVPHAVVIDRVVLDRARRPLLHLWRLRRPTDVSRATASR